ILLVNPHLTPPPATQHTPHLSTSHPPSAPSHTKHENMSSETCFRVLHVPNHTPHTEHQKHAYVGVFVMLGCFFTPLPHTGHEKHASETCYLCSVAFQVTHF